jgi:hypothetical protein
MAWHRPTRAYVQQRTEQGKSTAEIIRCLKALHRSRALPHPDVPAGRLTSHKSIRSIANSVESLQASRPSEAGWRFT